VATLSPPHLVVDGDTLFALATGTRTGRDLPLDALGLGAGEAVAEAVGRAIRAATSLGGVPAWQDLQG
jgi:L-aminopeptidase/D-esterase-like protein